jgi:hypothetical protein
LVISGKEAPIVSFLRIRVVQSSHSNSGFYEVKEWLDS